jgi:hypothetical protein
MAQTAAMATVNRQETMISNRFLLKLVAGMTAMALLTGATVIGGKWLGTRIRLGGNTESREAYTVEIGKDRLTLPANMIRFETQRRNGPAERLDLYLLWPEMEGFSAASSDRFNDLDKSRGLIFVQISQSVMSKDMSGRVEPIYSRYFEGAPVSAGNDLILHHFAPEAGYARDVLLTAPRAGDTDYAVRCVMPERPADGTSADCQRDFMAGRDLSVLYRFSSDLLPQWRQLDAAVSLFVANHLAKKTEPIP